LCAAKNIPSRHRSRWSWVYLLLLLLLLPPFALIAFKSKALFVSRLCVFHLLHNHWLHTAEADELVQLAVL